MSIAGKVVDVGPLPHNLEAERAVLGTMLLDNTTIPIVVDFLKKENFYNTAHQIIFDAIVRLFERNSVIDLTTLNDELRRTGELEKVGGTSYLASLEQFVLSTSNVQHHARIVYNKHKLRRLIEAAHRIAESALNEEDEVERILDTSEKAIFEISQDRAVRDFAHISDLVVDAMEEIQRRYHSKKDVTGLATGFIELDQLTCGLQRADLIIIAGRPSVGKTAFGLNIALEAAIGIYEKKEPQDRKPVGIFSLEMSSQQINHRFLCSLAHVSGNRVRTGYVSSVELKRLSERVKLLSDAPIYIDDTPGISILEVRAKARRLMAQRPDLALIIVDYLQLMRGSGKSENRQQEVAEISRSLKGLARELNVPLIAVSQLSRMIEHRRGKDKRPVLSDLRESGAIEQDADLVVFVHRMRAPQDEEEEEEEETTRPRKKPGEISEIIIGKQRNGPLGTVKLVFFPDFTMFATPPRGV
jgi:replicative DNA helicase